MSRKTRLIILVSSAVLFFIVTPYIVLYSLGYRVDLKNKNIIATGGIYVRVVPSDVEITIDQKITNRTNFFSNAIFVQNLLPVRHNILIKKEGYSEYAKDLLVKEKEVTKLENVILFKEKPAFSLVADDVGFFSLAPNNTTLLTTVARANGLEFTVTDLPTSQKEVFFLPTVKKVMFSAWSITWSEDSGRAVIAMDDTHWMLEPFSATDKLTRLPDLADAKHIYMNPQNPSQIFFMKAGNLHSTIKEAAILKGVLDYKIQNQLITWLGSDGFLYGSNMTGQTKTKLTAAPLAIKKNNAYEIITFSDMTFLKEGNSLLLLNREEKVFESFYASVTDIKMSPGNNQLLYFNDHEIFYYLLGVKSNIFMKSFPQTINEAGWLNNDYIYFISEGQVIISEIDIRGNINLVSLPNHIELSREKSIDLTDEEVIFNPSDRRFYILSQGNLLVSERMIP